MNAVPGPGVDVKSTCAYCGVGCGVILSKDEEGKVEVRGDPDHPANYGRLCSKGSALGDTLIPDGRLLHPQINGHRSSWEAATKRVAQKFSDAIRDHGPDSVAFYVSGQLLTEDYYVANKLMKGFIGSANIDTNSRLCMSSAVAAYKRAFGADLVPCCYEDLEEASLVILVGSNLAWCHPVLYQRLIAARKENGTKIIVVDPRKTASCEEADLHLQIRGETDIQLFNGLFSHLLVSGKHDPDFILNHTEGLEDLLQDLPTGDLKATADQCGIPVAKLKRFYKLFSEHNKTVTLFSMGVNQSSQGTDKANAIINCHLLTGRIGKPGQGPFSITGQPNAMGGREVGGLANMLTAHMDFNDADLAHLQEFWQAPNLATSPGLKAVELFEAIHSSQIKALWIMGTNPAVSLPNSDFVREALGKCEFIAVSDCIADTDTTRFADVLLPAKGWGEKSGTVTNSERRISRQRAVLPPAGEAKGDWWIITQVARQMGFGANFPYERTHEVFFEFARLTGIGNHGNRQLDLTHLGRMSKSDYEEMTPIQWPLDPEGSTGRKRLFADGNFQTPSGKAQFILTLPEETELPSAPFCLNTGRSRDQWHTMTRTGLVPRLGGHQPEPEITLNPEDAKTLELQDRDWVQVGNGEETAIFKSKMDPAVAEGSLFCPIHWSATNCSAGAINRMALVGTDPVSGQPDLKNGQVNVQKWNASWQGYLLTSQPIEDPNFHYWSRQRLERGFLYELADGDQPVDWMAQAREMLGTDDLIYYLDRKRGSYRWVHLKDGHIEGLFFVTSKGRLPDSQSVAPLMSERLPEDFNASQLLAGNAGLNSTQGGKQICACFGVNETTILNAIKDQGLTSAEAVGQLLKAGTNCGSCLPEINGLLHHDG